MFCQTNNNNNNKLNTAVPITFPNQPEHPRNPLELRQQKLESDLSTNYFLHFLTKQPAAMWIKLRSYLIQPARAYTLVLCT